MLNCTALNSTEDIDEFHDPFQICETNYLIPRNVIIYLLDFKICILRLNFNITKKHGTNGLT